MSDLTRAAEYLAQGSAGAGYVLIRMPLQSKIDYRLSAAPAVPDLQILDVTGESLAAWALAVIDGLCVVADEQARQIKNMEMRMMSREKMGRIEAALLEARRALDSRA